MDDKNVTHLQMIQEVIKRMASSSFALKGWAVTLVAGIYALSGKENNPLYFLISFVPVVCFWLLDSYYLQQERLYRALYDKVRQTNAVTDFSMKATVDMFSDEKYKFASCALSNTEKMFYLPLAVVCLAVIVLRWIFSCA